MLQKIVAVAKTVHDGIHAVLLALFLGLMAMVLTVYLGAGLMAALAAGVFGLVAGAMIAKRVWFTNSVPAAKPAPAEHRIPGVQDEFARIRARQGVLAFLLISELIALAAVRFAIEQDYPSLFGIPRNRFLAWVLALAAVTLALGLANWRCPSCQCNLGRSLSIRQCPRCEIVLRG